MFFQLKKAYHMNKGVDLQLLENPDEIQPEMNQFETLEYKIKAKNIGSQIKTKDEDSYTINTDQEFDFVVSDALYKSVRLYKQDSKITVSMVKSDDPKNRAGFTWSVKPFLANSSSSSNSSISTDQNIKWGMAFNNTTRLVSAFPLHRDEGIGDRVGLIEELLPKMYKIVCNMPKDYNEVEDDELFT